MTSPSSPILSIAVVAGVAAILGFGVARLGPGESAHAPDAIPGDERSASEIATHPTVHLPDADLSDPGQFDAYVEDLRSQGFDEELAQWLAISKKVRDDLPGSLAIARENGLERQWAAAVALTSPEEGFEALRSMRSGGLGVFGGLTPSGVFFETLGRTNPKLGFRLMDRLTNADAYGDVAAFFAGWTTIEPDAALTAASAIPARNVRESALLGLFREVGKSGLRAMMDWAESQGPGIARLAFRSQFELQGGSRNARELIGLAMEYPDAADSWVLTNTASGLVSEGAEGWKFLASFPPGAKRDGMMSWFANRLSETDPHAAWELVRSLPRDDQKIFLRSFSARDLVKAAPAEMTALALELESEMPMTVSVNEMVSHWSTVDPHAAFEWTRQNLKGSRSMDALGGAVQGWAQKDPQRAFLALDTLAPSVRAKLLPRVLSSWGNTDPQGALDFAATLPPMDRVSAMKGVFEGWSFKDPTAASEALSGMPATGMESAYDDVAYRLSQKDPARAGEWLSSISDERMRDRSARNVLENWAQKDSAAASEYLTQLETGGFRDNAIRGFVAYSKNLDPDAAAEWAASIENADARRDGVREVVESWRTTNRDAARGFASSLEPGPFRDEMLKLADERPEMGSR